MRQKALERHALEVVESILQRATKDEVLARLKESKAPDVCFEAAEKSAEYRIFRVYCGALFNSLRILIAAGFYLLEKQGVTELETVLDNLVTFRNYMESVIKTEDLRAAERRAGKEG